MIVDGVDLFTQLGLVVDSRQGGLDAPREIPALGQSPFAERRFIIGRQARDRKQITLRGALTADLDLTLSAGKTQLETRMDELKSRLRPRRTAQLSWTDITDRFWEVEFTDVIFRGFSQDWVVPARRVDIRMLAADPRAFSNTETTRIPTGFTSPDPVPLVIDVIPIGNVPQGGVVSIEGNTATPLQTGWTLEYRDSADAVLKSLIWDGQGLSTGQTVRIDLEDAIVELDTGSGFVNAIDDLRVGSDLPINVDPGDGDILASPQTAGDVPDLRLSGTGNVDTFQYVYRARFL